MKYQLEKSMSRERNPTSDNDSTHNPWKHPGSVTTQQLQHAMNDATMDFLILINAGCSTKSI
jgi:hypothetical protein